MTLNERHSSELRAASAFFSSAIAGIACDIRADCQGLQCRQHHKAAVDWPRSLLHHYSNEDASSLYFLISRVLDLFPSFQGTVLDFLAMTMPNEESITDSQSSWYATIVEAPNTPVASTPGESALLAEWSKLPSMFEPFPHPDQCLVRATLLPRSACPFR